MTSIFKSNSKNSSKASSSEKNILVPGPLAPPEPKITRTKPSDPSTRILRSASRPNRSPQHSDSGSDSDDALPRRVQFVS